MAKQRVYELAKELSLDKHELVGKINDLDLGFQVNNYMSTLTDVQAGEVKTVVLREQGEATREKLRDGVIRRRSKGRRTGTRRQVTGESDAVTPETVAASASAGESIRQTGAGAVVRRRKTVAPPPVEESAPVVEAPVAAPAVAESAVATPTNGATSPVAEPAKVEPSEPVAVEESAPVAKVAEVQPETTPVVEAEVDVAPAPVEEAASVEVAKPPVAESAPTPAEATGPEVTKENVSGGPSQEKASTDSIPASAGFTPVEPKPSPDGPKKDGSGKPVAAQGNRKRGKGAKILGRIDPEILKERLRAEGKSFGPPSNAGSAPSERTRSQRRPRPAAAPKTQGREGGAPSSDSPNSSGRNRRGKSRGRRTVGAEHLYDDNAKIRRLSKHRKSRKPSKTQITQAAEHKRVIKFNEAIILSDFARQMGVKANDLIRELMKQGEMMTINQAIDIETATILAAPFNFTVENVSFDATKYYEEVEDTPEELLPRPPVVTIMGHVDHGKTSLLDAIRQTNVASGEAGGITQHIGAYQVEVNDQILTFLDTPGHEAFTALRARGAHVTDIVILVVAADDGVMPQTAEAIAHAREAGVPIVVAINKIDKAGANPDRVKQALTEYELVAEEWGGDTQCVEVSALQGTNLDDLLEQVLLQAEILELKANPNRRGYGVVIESRLDIGLGAVASVLVQKGSLNAGDIVVAGEHYGRIRAMYNHLGEDVLVATPSGAAELTGLSGVPEAGEVFFAVEDEKTAREIVTNVQRKRRETDLALRAKKPTGLEGLTLLMQEGQLKELKVIVKADVQGSIEAVKGNLEKLGNDEVRVKVIHSAVGGITENDINLAASSPEGVIIVGFNVRPETRAQALAEARGIDLILRSVIYEIEEVITKSLEGMLTPIRKDSDLGRAEVREVFVVPKSGAVAGCYITSGQINRNGLCRIVRNSRIIYQSKIAGLRRFKDDVREVKSGFECGIRVENFNDIKVGDLIECYEVLEERATL